MMTNEVDTGLSTIHDLRPELFVGLMYAGKLCFQKKPVPLCGNLLTRRAFDFRNTVSVSYINPFPVYCKLLWVDARCSCGHVSESDGETEEASKKRLS